MSFVWRVSRMVLACLLAGLIWLGFVPLLFARPVSPPGAVIISEVAWAGTAASSNDEWLELYNSSSTPITLTGWTLSDGDNLTVVLSGVITAEGFFLLERSDDNTVSDLPADQIYVGSLNNSGEILTLRNAQNELIDSANSDGGGWNGGTTSPNFATMERLDPAGADVPANWGNNPGTVRNGLDANGNPLNGTPGRPNATWGEPLPTPTPTPTPPPNHTLAADLALTQSGPTQIFEGERITYTLSIRNNGNLTAAGVVLTDSLPAGVVYLTDTSGLPLQNSQPLVWAVGEVYTSTAITFEVVGQLPAGWLGQLVNQAQISTIVTETNLANNQASASTTVVSPHAPQVIIEAVLAEGQAIGQGDEAVRLWNVGAGPADLSGWQLTDGTSTAHFPAGTILLANQTLWVTNKAADFTAQFGHAPGLAISDQTLAGNWPGFADNGDEVILKNEAGLVQDVLVYRNGDVTVPGWSGPAVQPYKYNNSVPLKGQIYYRKRTAATGYPVPDTHQAADWAQDALDVVNGRKVRYPGWRLDDLFFPLQVTNTAVITLAVAPDNGFALFEQAINSAQETIWIQSHTFENLGIMELLVAAAQRGVQVIVLLEGSPPGGLAMQQKYVCQQLEAAGGQCWYMVNNSDLGIYDRYTYLHAKFMVLDGERVLISSENLSPNSLPYDDFADGTAGRRGVLLLTDAPDVVNYVTQLWYSDFAPAVQQDLFRYTAADPTYGAPDPTFFPITQTGGSTYTILYPDHFVTQGSFQFEVLHSPENSLRAESGILGLVNQAGTGDKVLVQQLSERPYWGESASNPQDDPNPRLEAYIAAARRGAQVWILLDGYFDDDSAALSNQATCDYVEQVVKAEGLHQLRCQLGNPAGLGIHNKMVLVELNGQGFIHLGSLNGTEQAHKGNRELAIQVQSNELYTYLAEMFVRDWPHRAYVPVLWMGFLGPVEHPVISEVVVDPAGPDASEFIEIANPTAFPIDLTGYNLSDAVLPTDFADLRHFPPGTMLPAYDVLVVAQQAVAFKAQYGINPDFEILDSDPAVPDLIDNPEWGDPATFLQLGNLGDVIFLRDVTGRSIDVLAYGDVVHPESGESCLVIATGHSLRRQPYWRDTNQCTYDFEDWPAPDPGRLP